MYRIVNRSTAKRNTADVTPIRNACDPHNMQTRSTLSPFCVQVSLRGKGPANGQGQGSTGAQGGSPTSAQGKGTTRARGTCPARAQGKGPTKAQRKRPNRTRGKAEGQGPTRAYKHIHIYVYTVYIYIQPKTK